MKTNLYIGLGILLLGLNSCIKPGKNKTTSEIPVENNILQTQVNQTGFTNSIDTVVCTGSVEVEPNYVVCVSTPINAVVTSLLVQEGNYVKKGDVLAVLEHTDIIKLQQSYFELKGEYEYLEQDFQRQGELSIEQATSIKIMQQAQSNYKITEAKLQSLEAQLKLLGLNPEQLHIDNIQTSIRVKSSIKGVISIANAQVGKYIKQETCLFQITDTSKTELVIHVPVEYQSMLQVGKDLHFSISNSNTYLTGTIYQINPWVKDDSVEVICKIKDKSNMLIPGLPARAYLPVNNDSVIAIQQKSTRD